MNALHVQLYLTTKALGHTLCGRKKVIRANARVLPVKALV
jgi:hypothetical protein